MFIASVMINSCLNLIHFLANEKFSSREFKITIQRNSKCLISFMRFRSREREFNHSTEVNVMKTFPILNKWLSFPFKIKKLHIKKRRNNLAWWVLKMATIFHSFCKYCVGSIRFFFNDIFFRFFCSSSFL